MRATTPLFVDRTIRGALAAALCLAVTSPVRAQDPAPEATPPEAAAPESGSQDGGAPPGDPEAQELPGVPGPLLADLGEYAEVQVPEGFQFLGPAEARELLEAMGNPASERELGLVIRPEGNWFVVFEYSDIGHVKDDEQDELDADQLLASLREDNEVGNEERRKRGWSTLELLGWAQLPHYDPVSNNLEWAIRGQSDAGLSINHNTRILGRTGVVEATLVCDAEDFETVLTEYKRFVQGFDFKSGHRYAEYVAGDKLAAYGLTALVAGGAGVLAAKSGLFSKLWKVLVVATLAVVGLAKKLFGRKSDKQAEA